MSALRYVLAIAIFAVAVEVHAGECQDHNWDHWKVAKALQQGLSKEALLMHLEGSRHELTPERMERIRGLIDEVFELPQTDAQKWFEQHRRVCDEEDEA